MIYCMANDFALMGNRIRDLRKRMHLSQTELADHVNRSRFRPDIKQSRISDLERLQGEQLPSVPLLAALAEALETNADYLLGLTDDDKPASDLEDQVVFEVRDPALRREMQEVAAMLRELTPEQLRTVRELMKMITPRKPRIIGGE